MPEMMRRLPCAGGGGGMLEAGPSHGVLGVLSGVLMESRVLVENGVSGRGGEALVNGSRTEDRGGGFCMCWLEGDMIVAVTAWEMVSAGIGALLVVFRLLPCAGGGGFPAGIRELLPDLRLLPCAGGGGFSVGI